MAIEGKKLNSMNVKVATKAAEKYDIEADVDYNNNRLASINNGVVRAKGTSNDMAVFYSNGSLNITFQNVNDGLIMVEILNAVNAYIAEVKAADPSTLLTTLEETI